MFEEKLQVALTEYGLKYSDDMILKFTRFYKLLLEWNEKMNLTAITKEDEFIQKHILDSLSAAEFIKRFNALSVEKKILDLGTGAGFPGIPLKIYYDDLNLTLMDALQKRINFLNEVIKNLKLNKILTLHLRAEEVPKNELRETFDIVFSRAVAVLPTLLEYALPFVKVNGIFIAWKGGKAKEEIKSSQNALKILGAEIAEIKGIEIPNLNEERTLIIIKKEKTTPIKYPRQSGMPKKKPL